ncbi:MAG: signal peptidase II [Candidatus Zixiibacteriota bacterium]|nr:MAG: signal peptidase II [candidate division Zixibacteria bacterium]
MRKLLIPFFALLGVVLLDQAAKVWAISYLADRLSVEVLGDFLMLTLVFNEGGAMGTNFGSPAYYLISSLLILLILMYYIYSHRDNHPVTVPLALICGGAIGNIIDRVRFGKVVDFLDVDFFNISFVGIEIQRWWTFNIADAVISCSIVYLLARIIFFPAERSQQHLDPADVDAS